MEINIQSKSGKEVLRFSNFIIKSSYYELNQIFISFKINIITNSISANFELDAELSDFEEMLNHLKVLNQDLKRTFYFQHSDERVKIKFSPNELGIINIEGFVFEEGYSSKVEFKFETDQSYLEEIIQQCENTVDNLKARSL